MKYFLAILCSFSFLTVFSQENIQKQSKWGNEFTMGLGSGELQSENFDITGNLTNINYLFFYKGSPKLRLLLGISLTHFTNASLLSDGYSNLKASFVEIPLKFRGQIWKPEQTNVKLMFGAGFQANKAYKYKQRINDKVFETSKTDWYVNVPLEIGIEFPLGTDNSLGVYLQSNYDLGSKNKKYVLKGYDLMKLALLVNF